MPSSCTLLQAPDSASSKALSTILTSAQLRNPDAIASDDGVATPSFRRELARLRAKMQSRIGPGGVSVLERLRDLRRPDDRIALAVVSGFPQGKVGAAVAILGDEERFRLRAGCIWHAGHVRLLVLVSIGAERPHA